MKPKIYIGIDIGTNNSCGYYYNENTGTKDVITINGDSVCPSYIIFKDDGSIICGSLAKQYFQMGRYDVIAKFKYFIGRRISEDEMERLSSFCGAEVRINDNGNSCFHLRKIGTDITPGGVYSKLIQTYVNQAVEKFDGEVEGVRLTVPSGFDNNQRQVIKEAAANCGIPAEKVTLIQEPTAAAYMYCRSSGLVEGKILIYDFGGGTFDVSLVELKNGDINVLDSKGNTDLGGTNVDERIANEVLMYMDNQQTPLYSRDTPEKYRKRIYSRLIQLCEEAKIKVQTTQTYNIDAASIAFIQQGQGNPYVLTLECLKSIIRPLVTETITLVRKVLDDNHLTCRDISFVVLVGGSSLYSMVREELTSMFGADKVKDQVSPKEIVAQGACMSLVGKFNVRERTTYSLGLETKRHINWMIPENTPLPVEKVVHKITTEDYQSYLYTYLVQGHCREIGNKPKLNYVRLEPIICDIKTIDRRGEVSFDITYTVEEDGCVKVRIVENNTGTVLFDNPLRWTE